METVDIQGAIHRAGDGDRVLIGTGTYRELLTIDKNLILRGEGANKVRLLAKQHYSPTLQIGPSPVHVRLRNLSIGDSNDYRTSTVMVTGKAKLTVNNCRIEAYDWCVAQSGRSTSYLIRTRLRGGNYGLVLLDQSQSLVSSCTLSGYGEGTGLALYGSSKARMDGCKVQRFRDGVLVWDRSRAHLHNNRLLDLTRYGILCQLPALTFRRKLISKINRFEGIGEGEIKWFYSPFTRRIQASWEDLKRAMYHLGLG